MAYSYLYPTIEGFCEHVEYLGPKEGFDQREEFACRLSQFSFSERNYKRFNANISNKSLTLLNKLAKRLDASYDEWIKNNNIPKPLFLFIQFDALISQILSEIRPPLLKESEL